MRTMIVIAVILSVFPSSPQAFYASEYLGNNQRNGYTDAHVLLGNLLERQGRKDEAIEVYRKAADNAQLPPQVRAQFAARHRALSKP